MQKPIAALLAVAAAAVPASAQWIGFTNQTPSRMVINLTGVTNDTAIQVGNDPTEKDYAWGDVDRDGDIDLVFIRKQPLSFPGGKRNILFLNDNGVLVDHTVQYATAALGVPAGEGVSQGFLDLTNDRQVLLVDVNNDGWLDIVTAGTIADGLPRYIGHPRVYMNLGKDGGGNWLGYRYEYARIPQLISNSGIAANPRFCSVAAGDLNNDGFADLYFSDYDTGEVGPSESSSNDMDNRLLMNSGFANPGVFTDQSIARMGANYNYSPGGSHTLLWAFFGAHGVIADMNGDGINDVLKNTTLGTPLHVAMLTNPGAGTFSASMYKVINAASPYNVSAADLNGDGRLDLVITDDGNDRYLLNTGNDLTTQANFTQFGLSSQLGTENEFGTQITMADLDNDGWLDFLIVDEDADTFYPGNRRSRIYHNQGNPPNVTLREDSPSIIPTTNLKSLYRAAMFDINGDGWTDMVFGRGNPSGSNNAGSSEVWMNNGKPGLVITYPSGRPALLTPNAATNFNVQFTGTLGGTPMANSGKIFISVNGGAFVQSNMAPLGGDLYQATIPAQTCGASVRYYISGQVTTGATQLDPAGATYNASTPLSYYSAQAAGSTSTLLSEDFEGAAPGWTTDNDIHLASGAWELATPVGSWNDGVQAAPSSAHGGTKCYVTGNGTAGQNPGVNSVHSGYTRLVSPVLNLAGSNATISYSYWMYGSMNGPVMTVQVSNDGGSNWTTVATHAGPRPKLWNDSLPLGGEVNAWKDASFEVGNFVTPTAQVMVRFSVQDTTTGGVVEAGIDDFAVAKAMCAAPCGPDVTGDSQVNVTDLLLVINSWGACAGCPADINDDGQVNVTDLLAVINGWGPCP